MSGDRKKTGLGLGNLLLQRTVPPPARPGPRHAPDPDATQGPAPAETKVEAGESESAAPARPSRPPKRKRLKLRVRRTLHLEVDLDEQLSAVAGIERRERSEVVNELLRKHLRKYEITLKK